MSESDVFGIEKVVLTQTVHSESGADAADTRIVCTGFNCTGNTCVCAAQAE